MPKHPVPKKKTARATTKTRYSKFQALKRKQLENRVHLIKCPDCGAMKQLHHVCKECGKYKGREVLSLEKKIEKITKVKA
jgi:large subunit ribosomal protein L32